MPGIFKFIVQHPEQAFEIMLNFKKRTLLSQDFDIANVEMISGLNAAFTLQMLFGLFQKKPGEQLQTEHNPLALALKIHIYVNFAQVIHGTTLDVSKMVGVVKTLLRQESLVQKPLSTFMFGFKQFAMEGTDPALGIASVALDIIELEKARTSVEKTLFGTHLAFDTGSLALSAASMSTALLGAADTAAVLGSSGALLAGIDIGITALVINFSKIAAKAEAVGAYFHHIDHAYKHLGYKEITLQNQTCMAPIFGAVITEIDFRQNNITYGNQYIYRTSPRRTGEYGSGRINYITWGMPRPVLDKEQALTIRERLGYPQQIKLTSWQDYVTWILPFTPESYMNYRWQILTGYLPTR